MSTRLKLFAEVFGLHPLPERLRQTMIALRGDEDVPPSRMGLSSLRMLRPRMAFPLWRGRPFLPGRVIVTNLFNHLQTPVEAGWSVKRTQVLDFRGGDLTYDSHNGTDFSVPVGTPVLAPAPGRIALVLSEFNRGGLKVLIDHGRGLMTCSAHLARALVREGDDVARGEPVALSGYSGLDGFASFPFGVPHVHFNTWLNGEPVDPFAHGGAPSMWVGGSLPLPPPASPSRETFTPSVYDEEKVSEIIDGCRTEHVKQWLGGTTSRPRRAARTLAQMNYYPTRFALRQSPYDEPYPRETVMSLPFPAHLFKGVVFADELRP